MSRLAETLDALRRHVETLRHTPPTGDGALDAAEAHTVSLLDLCLRTLELGSAPDAYTLREVRTHLGRLDPRRFPWVADALRMLPAATLDLDAPLEHEIEVGRRVVSAQRTLDGGAPIDFGTVTVEHDDLRIGPGLRLSDGSLQHMLTALARHTGSGSPLLALQPAFDVEAEALAAAIEKGRDAIAEHLRSQLVWRYDARVRRLVASLPDAWMARLSRLAGSLEARRLQLELAVGPQLMAARSTARESGLRSLRGLTFAFDAEPLLSRLRARYGVAALEPASQLASGDDTDQMIGLVERILARTERPLTRRLESRFRSLVEGAGEVDGRAWDESMVLGPDAHLQPWRYTPDRRLQEPAALEAASAVPVPGREYVVKSGDHLGSIARAAWGRRGDFRVLLAHNPHLDPGSLQEGQRLFVPQWPSRALDRASRVRLVANDAPQAVLDADRIRLPGRVVGPLPGQPRDALAAAVRRLCELEPHLMQRARAVRLDTGWALLVEGHLVLELGDGDLPTARTLFARHDEPLAALAAHLASQLRGDIVLEPGESLPFGHRAQDAHRTLWVRAALRRLRAEPERAARLELRVVDDGAAVEIVDPGEDDAVVVRLESEDLDAIEQQPARRLYDLRLHGAARAEALAGLWLRDLRREPAELLVAPVAAARRGPLRPEAGGVRFLLPMGTPVFAIAPGVVRQCGPTGGGGQSALVEHVGGLFSRYQHLAALAVRPGARLDADQLLGRSGLSGEVDEPCLGLSLEVRPVDGSGGWHDAAARPLEAAAWLGRLWP